MSHVRIHAWCICGATFKASSSPPVTAEQLHYWWLSGHSGEGHAPCDAQTARNARRRQERAWLRDEREANA